VGYDVPGTGRGGARSTFFAWVMPERRHVHIGFVHGTLLEDRDGRLEGRGITKRARWLTYVPGDAIDVPLARAFLLDAVAVARRDRRERSAELALAAELGR
jgi:hypothetical protein